ncbi:MAG: 3-dehydroquinate synthase, partial [Limisphaerales bacterium]
LKGLEEFREHLGGQLTITSLQEIGKGVQAHAINLPKVVEAIYELQERHNRQRKKLLYAHG